MARSIKRRIRHNADGIQIVADVNVSISGGEPGDSGSSQHVSSHQRVVQRNGRTIVSEQATRSEGPDDRKGRREEPTDSR